MDKALIIIAFIVGISCAGPARIAQAQQNFDFGLRFDRFNFQPNNFNSFNFRGYSFNRTNAQTIQFENINFPAFNSRSVRRELTGNQTPTGQLSLRNRNTVRAAQQSNGLTTARTTVDSNRLGYRSPFPDSRTRVARQSDPVGTPPPNRLARRPIPPPNVRTATRLRAGELTGTRLR